MLTKCLFIGSRDLSLREPKLAENWWSTHMSIVYFMLAVGSYDMHCNRNVPIL